MSVRSINLTVEEAYEKYNERNHPLSKNDFHAYMDSLDISFRKEGEVKFRAINLSSLAGAYGKPFLPDPDKESCPLEGLFKSYCRAFGGLKEHEIEVHCFSCKTIFRPEQSDATDRQFLCRI